MPVAGTQTSESEKPSAADRIVDAVQHAAHMSHEARLVKSLAYDAIEDGAHEAKRAVKKIGATRYREAGRHQRRGCPLREASASEGHRDGRWRRSEWSAWPPLGLPAGSEDNEPASVDCCIVARLREIPPGSTGACRRGSRLCSCTDRCAGYSDTPDTCRTRHPRSHECDAVARTECRSSSDRAAQRRAVELRQRAGWSLRWARGQRLRCARRRSIGGVVQSGWPSRARLASRLAAAPASTNGLPSRRRPCRTAADRDASCRASSASPLTCAAGLPRAPRS